MKEGWYEIVPLKQRFKTAPDSGQYSTFSFCFRRVGIINYENPLL
jgi:hypothetical protein